MWTAWRGPCRLPGAGSRMTLACWNASCATLWALWGGRCGGSTLWRRYGPVAWRSLGGGGDWSATEPAAEAAGELVSRFRDPRYVASRVAKRLGQGATYAEYPRQIHNLLNELKDGEIEVVLGHRGLDELISKVDILANRLVFALLIAALIVGSSLLGIFGESG